MATSFTADSISSDYARSVENAQLALKGKIADAGLNTSDYVVDVTTKTEIIKSQTTGQTLYKTTLSAVVATVDEVASGAVKIGTTDAANPNATVVTGAGGTNNVATVVVGTTPAPSAPPPLPSAPVATTAPTPQKASADIFKDIVRKENILHNFKSYNYLFTLSALEKNSIRPKQSYGESSMKYVIAKSAGKGKETAMVTGADVLENNNLIDQFNQVSPGRFDFYFDDVEMENIIGFNQRTSVSKATSINFTIIEPYSIHGFLDALQASAVAAGYDGYRSAFFLFKIEFIGYPDDKLASQGISSPTKIDPYATRYFPIMFSDVQIKIDQSGTRYTCKTLPFDQIAFGNIGKLPTTINIKGNTVKAVLNNLMSGVVKSFATSLGDPRDRDQTTIEQDLYFIDFPENPNEPILGSQNKFATSIIADLDAENVNYAFPDPVVETKKNAKRLPIITTKNKTEYSAQFVEGSNILDCIVAVVRDCEEIQKLFIPGKKEGNGKVTYFYVQTDIQIADRFSSVLGRFPFIITYRVMPYEIHQSRIPDMDNKRFDPKNFNNVVRREYNYLYTGNNVDIISFNLNLNNLYFTQVPNQLGELKGYRKADTNNEVTKVRTDLAFGQVAHELQTGEQRTQDQGQTPGSTGINQASNRVQPEGAPSTRGPSNNAYVAYAKQLHQRLIDSVDLLEAEVEIIGDPFYIVTGGYGGTYPKKDPNSPEMTDNGEANHIAGDIHVRLTFKNVEDYDPVTGLLTKKETILPFSGIYRINEVTSRFSGGQFTQRLKLLQLRGQAYGQSVELEKNRQTSAEGKKKG